MPPAIGDTGADRTVLSASVLRLLDLPGRPSPDRIGGLVPAGGTGVLFRGEFAAVPELEALEMGVLGRDIAGRFSVVVGQPANAVHLPR